MAEHAQLITYVDRFGGENIANLHQYLRTNLSEEFQGLHLLPFFYPFDGKDAGYDPVDNRVVDDRLGDWEDIEALGKDFDLMVDMIVNHISADSPQFQDVIKNGSSSPYFDMFLTKNKVFQTGDSNQIEKIFRPGANLPFTTYKLNTGEQFEFWTTFSDNQLDIDVTSTSGREYILNTLRKFAAHGVQYVRLDAIGFAIKKAGTTCFMLPETYEFIQGLKEFCNELGMIVLLEVHADYSTQAKAARHADFVYDFAIPPLILHSFETNNFAALKKWLPRRPKNCVNVLDTHDGIGIYDAAASGDDEGMLTDLEIENLGKAIHKNTGGSSELASGTNAENLDISHINSSFYDAMGRNDFDYLGARAIQLFLPGIPQIYYGGFLAAHNDTALLQQTNNGRDINRPYYSFADITQQLQAEVVLNMRELLVLRNTHPAFQGSFSVLDSQANSFHCSWNNQNNSCELLLNLEIAELSINYTNTNQPEEVKTISYVK